MDEYYSREELSKYLEGILKNDRAVFLRWVIYAEKLLKICCNEELKNIYTGEDVVFELIEKMLDGKRRIPQCSIGVNTVIRNDIKSVISNYSKLKLFKHNTVTISERDEIEDYEFNSAIAYNDIIADDSCLPDANLFVKELEVIVSQILPEEESIVMLYIKDGYANKEMAKELGITIKEVEAIKKRIKRKLDKSLPAEYKIIRNCNGVKVSESSKFLPGN
jgi:DNA-directed RNA polymerase specialized sigma24 family protein